MTESKPSFGTWREHYPLDLQSLQEMQQATQRLQEALKKLSSPAKQ